MSSEAERAVVDLYDSVLSGEEAIRTLAGLLSDGVSIVDEGQEFLFVNPPGERLFGSEAGGLIGRKLWEFVHPEAFNLIQRQLATRRRGGTTIYDLEIMHDDGKRRRLRVTASPRFSGHSRFRGAFAFFRDITDSKRLKEQSEDPYATVEARVRAHPQRFRESRDLLRTVIEGTSEAIFAKDLDGRYQLLNSAASALFERDIQQVIGRTDHELLASAQAARLRREDQRVIESGESTTMEETLSVKGSDRTFLTKRAVLRDEDGNVTGVVGMARDITRLKKRADTGDTCGSGPGCPVEVRTANPRESTGRTSTRFGEIALDMGFISSTDLEEALTRKVREPAKTLGEILMDRGCLTAEQAMQILDEIAVI